MASDSPAPQRRTTRVRHEVRRRDVIVSAITPISETFVAITFAGEALGEFQSDGFDDHIKFVFTNAEGQEVRRDYTPRSYDRTAATLTIEFSLHGHGAASEWARFAKIGAPAIIGGPKSSMVIPIDYDWHLLIGDSTALPAIARRLEELPANATAFVIMHAPNSDQRTFNTAARADIRWLTPEEDLLAHVRALALPAGEGFAWAAGEATAMPQLRDVLAVEKSIPREAMRVASYWRQGVSDAHEVLK
jgi:NADPH-dependent ferric siderophore reductase